MEQALRSIQRTHSITRAHGLAEKALVRYVVIFRSEGNTNEQLFGPDTKAECKSWVKKHAGHRLTEAEVLVVEFGSAESKIPMPTGYRIRAAGTHD